MSLLVEEIQIVTKRYSEIIKPAFLSYAMSVITDRALPDVRDGLKPVHRRILWAMYESGNVAGKPYRKSARTVGDVIGKYHPHGDAAVYQALVRLAQPWILMTPLIDGQGNFGSIDDDPPAAMRYTEARLSRVATETFFGEIDAGIDFRPNYDGTQKEPVVLPVAFPNLLVNGVEGIAVGMAASIPTHNLREVVAATKRLIETDGNASDEELIALMPAPDFPTGGVVYDLDGYRSAFVTGRGRVRVRATYEIEKRRRGEAVVFTSIPYGVSKAKILEEIAALVKDKKIDGIADLRDESNKEGLRIWVAIKTGFDAHAVAQALFAQTNLDRAVNYNITVLDDGGVPREVGIRTALLRWIAFRRDMVRKRFEAELQALEARAHILQGLMRAIDMLDDTIATIRRSQTVQEAKQGLMTLLAIDETQAQAILDLRLHRLAAFELNQLREEHESVLRKITQIRAILDNPKEIDAVIIEELDEIADRFGCERLTEIASDIVVTKDTNIVVKDQAMVVFVTERGYIVCRPDRANSDRPDASLIAQVHGNSRDLFFLVTNTGRLYVTEFHQLPDTERHVRNLFEVDDEVVAAFGASEETCADLVFVTKQGTIKRSDLALFASPTRRTGTQAITLDEGDKVVSAFLANEHDTVALVTEHGYGLRFPLAEVRGVGRIGKGVIGMRFKEPSDSVAGAVPLQENDTLIVCTQQGKEKTLAAAMLEVNARAGKGNRLFPKRERIARVRVQRSTESH